MLLEALEMCERKTGVSSNSIPLDSPDVFRAIISGPSGDELTGIEAACLLAGSRKTKRFSDMCDALDVHDVGSLCRALSLNHGSGIWIDNQDKLYQEGRIILLLQQASFCEAAQRNLDSNNCLSSDSRT